MTPCLPMFQKNLRPHRRVGEFLLPRSRSEYDDEYHNLLRHLRENTILHSHRCYNPESLTHLHISTTRYLFSTICMVIATNLNRFMEWRCYHLVVTWSCIMLIRNEFCYKGGKGGATDVVFSKYKLIEWMWGYLPGSAYYQGHLHFLSGSDYSLQLSYLRCSERRTERPMFR
jgi:hypothetical protein